jgi:basic membrane protein A
LKKFFIALLALALILPLAACKPAAQTFELALITDIGDIDDRSFNQGSWEGLVKYAEEHKISHIYFKPQEKSTASYLEAIDLAVQSGAKVIVTPGFLFEPAIFQAQDLYPDVKFILLDGTPNDGNWGAPGGPTFQLNSNVYSVFYAEEQAGFLAGYAAVKDGFTRLGFMGGMAVPAVVRFGYGFVQGAEYAARELGLESIELKYHYTGQFAATPQAQALAASWFNAGIEVIFACGGALGDSVMRAAEANNGKVIGVDVDQSNLSETVITSAMKQLGVSVYDALAAFYAGNFPGGRSVTLDAKIDGIGLPMATSRFRTFTQADYDAIFARLVAGEIAILRNNDVENVTQIPTEIVVVDLIN